MQGVSDTVNNKRTSQCFHMQGVSDNNNQFTHKPRTAMSTNLIKVVELGANEAA